MSTSQQNLGHKWQLSKLTDLLTVIRGVTYKKEFASNSPKPGMIPILRANNIQSGLVFEDLVYVPKDCVSENQLLHVGDIIIAASSGSRHIVGKAAQLTTAWNGSFGTFCFGLRPKPGVHPGYLASFLQTSEYRHQVSELSAGVNINNLRASHIEEIPIPVAPLSEQRRIVAEIEKQFTRLDAGVAALKRAQANLQRYRASVLKAACEGRLVPTEASLYKPQTPNSKLETGEALLQRILAERRKKWVGRGKYKEPATPDTSSLLKLPQDWTLATVEQLSNRVQYGHTASASKRTLGPRFLRITDIQDGGVDWSTVPSCNISADEVEDLRLLPGDIVFARTGATVGKSFLLSAPFPESVFASYLIRISPATSILSSWLYAFFQSPDYWAQIRDSSAGIGQPNVNGTKLQALRIPLPPLVEQKRIVAEVERRLSVVDELEATITANLTRATRLRQSILQKAFSGELVARRPVISESKVEVMLQPGVVKRPNSHFARALLSAEIVYHLHDEPTFGRVKHQKILHLCEHIAQIEEVKGQYHREAAGPLDNRMIYASEAELRKQKWYETVTRNSYGHAYKPLAKAGCHRKYMERYWPEKLSTIERLIKLMRTWSTDQCEIFCTAYAAWNDLILGQKQPTPEAILHEILECWHERKKRISEDRWRKAIVWMKDKGFIPTGFGRPTIRST